MQLFAHGSARAGEGSKGGPSHAKSRDCVSASGAMPKGGGGRGGVKKFRRGRGPQVPSLKPGGGVEGRKIRERQVDALKGRRRRRRERGREVAAPLSPVRMGK